MVETSVSTNVLERMQEKETALSRVPERYLQLIKKTIAPGASNEELELFLYTAAQYNLDPLMKEIYFLKVSGKYSPIVARDGYAKIAKQNPNYDGYDSMVVRENDDFKMDAGEGEVHHIFGHNRGKITGAWARARYKGRPTVVKWAEFSEYRKRNSNAWDNYPTAMIQKVAETMALRAQFDITGTSSASELGFEDESGTVNEPMTKTISAKAKGTVFLEKEMNTIQDAELIEKKSINEEDRIIKEIELEKKKEEETADKVVTEIAEKPKKPLKAKKSLKEVEATVTGTVEATNEQVKLTEEKKKDDEVVEEQIKKKVVKEVTEEPKSKKIEDINLDEMDLTDIDNLKTILSATKLDPDSKTNLMDLSKKLLKRQKIEVPEFVKIKEQIKAL